MKTIKDKFSGAGLMLAVIASASIVFAAPLTAMAVCPPGQAEAFPGSDICILDPLSIPKYVIPLVIPPVMNNSGSAGAMADTANTYDIAVRQFQQQILPGGIWNTINGRSDAFPATTVWSYGPAGDTVPAIAPDANSQFNYPSYTIETTSGVPVDVRWINDLVDGSGAPLPHLLAVDQTLHWANPGATACADSTKTIDCTTDDPTPYTGAVPIVTHVHGAHVEPHSDGYPEAWWLPAGVDPLIYTTSGTLFDDATGANPGNLGYADYNYIQTQPATTLWYHDHALGMTRLNVYAGPAGFWLVRGDYTAPDGTIVADAVDDGTTPGLPADGILPGPAPVAGQDVLQLNVPSDPIRQSIREIPIVIQDRSFKPDGSLFYPENRAFFEGLNAAGGNSPILSIDFVPDSDIAPIWNPEAFFTTMVVNGVVWPQLEVAPALYRLRLLNGSNSRFLNLSLQRLSKKGKPNKELYFYQIGSDQGFLPNVVEIKTGKATVLPGDGLIPINRTNGTFKDQALLMGLAERADVIVDFRGLKNGTVVQMVNTAPDAPFGGFPDIPADPATTGQVMQFVVNTALFGASPFDGAATDPYALKPISEPASTAPIAATRQLTLNEEESSAICVEFDMITGNLLQLFYADGTGTPVSPGLTDLAGTPCFDPTAIDPVTGLTGAIVGVPMAPKAALLGTLNIAPDPVTMLPTGTSSPMLWSDPITERPIMGDTEIWELYNLTVDGHPMHLHLVRFEVIDRQLLDPLTNLPVGIASPPNPWETGYKDTVIAYPGEVTRVKATFDLAGLYVWHCHIVEHEDNEMMRPYCVDEAPGVNSCVGIP